MSAGLSMQIKAACAIVAAAAFMSVSGASAIAAPVGTVTGFPTGLPSEDGITGITPGPDGAIWFVAGSGPPGAIGRMATDGAVSTFSTALNPKSGPWAITTGAEGDLWFTDWGVPKAIGRFTLGGSLTEFSAGLSSEDNPRGDIVLGSDGNLWFGDRGRDAIGRITPTGTITEFTLGLDPEGIAPGPDGNVWVAERLAFGAGAIARVMPSGEITKFTAGLNKGSEPVAIASGTDGNLWFTDFGPTKAIGRITPSGEITEFSTGLRAGSAPERIAPGPDGNMWFTNDGETRSVGRITPSGVITEFSAGISQVGGPVSIAPAEDGNMWVADEAVAGSPLLRVGTGAPAALTSPPSVEGGAKVGVPTPCISATWSTWNGQQPSAGLFSYDGYRWLIDGSVVAAGHSYTPTPADAGHALSCVETVTYPLPYFVTAVGESASTQVLPQRPKITRFREKRTAWRERTGTAFSFSMNEQAAVRLRFSRHVRRCGASRNGRARLPMCRGGLHAGTLSFSGSEGHNKVAFRGRLSRSTKLRPGHYTATISARNFSGMKSKARSLDFTILK